MFDLVIPGMCVQVATKALLKETAYHCSVLPSDTPIQGNFSDWEDRLPLSCSVIAWCLPQLCHTSLTTPRPHRRGGEVFDQSPFWAHLRRAKVAPQMMLGRSHWGRLTVLCEEGETAGFFQTLWCAGTGSREKGMILQMVSEYSLSFPGCCMMLNKFLKTYCFSLCHWEPKFPLGTADVSHRGRKCRWLYMTNRRMRSPVLEWDDLLVIEYLCYPESS